MNTATVPSIRCSDCGMQKDAKATAKGIRLPRNWKRRAEQVYCDKCWHQRYRLSAVTLAVSGPIGREWPELREALRILWGETTRAVNWMNGELYARDVRREPGSEKLPAQPKTYLYPETTAKFPSLPSQSAASLEQSVQQKYRTTRYEVLWTNERSLANAKYPQPAPVSAQSWKLTKSDDGPYVFSAPLDRNGRWELRLATAKRPHVKRQLEQIVSSEAVPCEAAIFRKRANLGGRGNGAVESANGGAPRVGYQIMVKLVAWFPRGEIAGAIGTFYVRTGPEGMLAALDTKGEKVWDYHGEQLRTASIGHALWLQRWSNDTKAEVRKPKRRRAKRDDHRQRHIEKQRNRMKSLIQQAAAALAGFAARRKYAAVEYRDEDRAWCPQFDWSGLKTAIQQALDKRGIELVESASGKVTSKRPEPLVNEVSSIDL